MVNNSGAWYGKVPVPLKLGAVLGASIFLIEMVIMLLDVLPPGHPGALLDAGLLAGVVSPILYLALVHPLATQIRARDAAQAGLLQAHSLLEHKVEERTWQLTESVGALEREVEERRRAEGRLLESEGRLRIALEAATLGAWEYRFGAGEMNWDDRCREMWGVPDDHRIDYAEVISRIHPHDRTAIDEAINVALAGDGGGVYCREFRVVWPDGSVHWISSHGAVYFEGESRHGSAVRFAGVDRDVSEQRRAEEALYQAEERLRQAQRMEAVGQLAGGVAHDFNNLLTAILGYSSMILSRSLPPELRHEVDEVRKAAERAASLTRQLLAFSRRQPLQPQVIDLNDIVASMGSLLGRVLGEDISLQLRLGPQLWPVEADPTQIEQVLLNLAVNARDAMPAGGNLTIETGNVRLDDDYASVHPESVPGAHVLLAVSDNGSGMDADTLSQVFEPFFTTKDPGKGTGLGLATVHGIIKQSGGDIWVYSEPGKGTTFKIYLPEAAEAVVATPPPISDDTLAPTREPGRETILLVEDEAAVRDLTVRILTREGYLVLAADSALQALSLTGAHPGEIDLVLTDVVLPGMGGRELADSLHADRPGLKILFMSGYTRDAIVHDGRLDAGIAFLEKPFTPQALTAKVRSMLAAGAVYSDKWP